MILNFHEWGNKSQPAMLMLHGFIGSGADWTTVAQALPEYHAIAPDLPGHGRSHSTRSAAFSMEAAADSVIALLDAQEIDRCALVGYSMGGRLALYLAVHFPERFDRLVLESSSPGIADSAERDARQQWDHQTAAKLTSQPFDDFPADWYAMPLFASFRAHPDYPKVLMKRLENNPRQLALSMQKMGTGSQPSLWEAWAGLAIETLLIVGELDEKYVDISAEMLSQNPRAQRIIIPNTGHNTHFENPATFAQHLIPA